MLHLCFDLYAMYILNLQRQIDIMEYSFKFCENISIKDLQYMISSLRH